MTLDDFDRTHDIQDYTEHELAAELSRRFSDEHSIPIAWAARFVEAALRLTDLLCKKQRKYGPKNVQRQGQVGVFDRMWEKMERLDNLQQVEGAVREDVLEEVDDYAGLSLILGMLLRGEWPDVRANRELLR